MRRIAALLLAAIAFPAFATCIPSGVTDQYTYFVAVDSTDFTTRETGLSSFTVYRSRNGGAAAAFTTPTINETSSSNMPGVYELLLDEDMTIDSGDDVQHMVVHITHAGMAPVTKEFCIARAKITAGNTLTVDSEGDGNANVTEFGGNDGTFASGRPAVNTTHLNGTAQTARDIGASVLLSSGTGTGQVLLSSGTVTVGTNNDKTGYSLSSSQTFNLTGSITGNLSGSVGSVTGDIGGIAPNGLTLDAFHTDTNPLFGIVRRGTAQSATSTSLVIDSAASFGDDVLNGMTMMACGSTQGYCQSRVATGYTGSSDTATVDAWSVTPSGTITFYTYGTAPSSGGGGGGATAQEIWEYETRTLTAFDEDSMTIDIDGTAVGAVASVTGNVGGNVTGSVGSVSGNVGGTVNGLTATAQGHVRTAVGLSTANLDTQLSTIDNVADGIKAVTDELPDAGALTSLATASALTTVDGVVGAIKTTTDKLDDTLELDSTVYRFTANALEQAPAGEGGGGSSDWNSDEKAAIAAILGIPESGTTPADPSSGILDTIRDAVAGLNDVSTSDVQSAVGSALGTYDPPTRAELTSDINSILSALSGLNDLAASDLRDLIIEDQGGGVSLGCALSVILAYAAGDLATTGNSPTFEDPSGTETRISGTISSAGNRSMTITCPSY
jgi:hypothetical protein